MELRLLGPLEVRADDGATVPVRGRHHPRILAALTAESGQTVTLDRLIRGIWDGETPDTAPKQIQNAVAGLRRQLGVTAEVLATVGRGYRLIVPPEQVDWLRFRRHWTTAQEQRRSGRAEAALASMRAALAEWRGPALAGLTGPLTEGIANRLNDNRMSAIEDRLELELEVGDGDALAGEVRYLVAEYPLRQRFTGLLMRALCREGRSAEALSVFAGLRDRLRDELGVDPDPRLVELHTEILRQEPTVLAAAAPPVTAPATRLPHDVPDFTGREQLLSELDAELSVTATAPVVVLSGTGGVGKTALALHWARRAAIAEAFDDGRLFVDLQGFTDNPPVGAADAIADLLRQLGVPGSRAPSDLDDARALARQLLEQRRCLVILDNAADAAQVRPLLLTRRPSLTLVTSRSRLAGLAAGDGAHRIGMDALTPQEARRLLHRLLGAVDEPDAILERLIELCARLPLALRVAAAGFADIREHATLADFVEQLHADRLGTLDLDDADTAVATVLSRSTNRLDPPLLEAFCRLGAHPGPRVDLAALAVLWGSSETEARRTVRRLLAVHLAESSGLDGFSMHDLLREHALELARHHAVDLAATRDRLLAHYTRLLADRDLDPEWAAGELPSLLACLRLPDGGPLLRYALTLGEAMLELGRFREAAIGFGSALAAAPAGSVEHYDALRGCGAASYASGDNEAEQQLTEALAGYRRLGDAFRVGRALRTLGERARWLGDVAVAKAYSGQALERFTESGDRQWRADALTGHALDLLAAGEHSTAAARAAEALRLATELDDRRIKALAHDAVACVALLSGDSDTAGLHYRAARQLFTAAGDRAGVAGCALGLGRVALDDGDPASAEPQLELALAMSRGFGDTQMQAITLHKLAKAAAGLGDHARCREALTAGRELCRDNGDLAGEGYTTTGIAESLAAQGRHREAVAEFRHAIDVFGEPPSYPLGAAQAHRGSGEAYAALGEADAAGAHWRRALRVLEGLDSPAIEELRGAVTVHLNGLGAARSRRGDLPAGSRGG